MSSRTLASNQQGAVSVLFAGAAVPIIGLIGLSIDFAVLTQARTQMALAADTAAISSVKVATNDFAGGDTGGFQGVGKKNATDWFAAQVGGSKTKANPSAITLRGGALVTSYSGNVARIGVTITSTVTYAGSVPATFSALFGLTKFNIQGQSVASEQLNAYVNIALLLDNSSSMLIGATTTDINTLQTITPCSPEGTQSGQSTSAWTGPWPQATCPKTYTWTAGGLNPPTPPTAGKAAPTAACGFACHWSTDTQTYNGKPDYTQYDYYALARNPAIGPITGYTAPTLRFDVVQTATANVISTMETSNVVPDQFGLTVFTFNSALTQVYPAAGTEASTNLTAGATAVAAITTPVVSNNGDTDFPDSLTSVASKLTKAGDGSSTSSPKKALFIVTDGIQDYGSRSLGDTMGPMSNIAATNACTAIKNMGITVYVLYTPYTPLPYNPFYVSNIATYVNTPPTPNAIVTALQACASTPTDFYEADLPSQVTTGLQTLLKAAAATPARISS